MKAIAIVGSPRKNGNTELLAAHTLEAIAEEGIYTELVRLAGLTIAPCTACMACKKEDDCSIKDDFRQVYPKMKEADAIILASPVYYGSATALIKALMERRRFPRQGGRAAGSGAASRQEFYLLPAHAVVPDTGLLYTGLFLLERGHRP